MGSFPQHLRGRGEIMLRRVCVCVALVVSMASSTGAASDKRAVLPDGQTVILHEDHTWEYHDALCPGAPADVPTFSGFTSLRPGGGSPSQPGGTTPLMVRGGADLMSGNQFVPGSYVLAVAIATRQGLAVSRWEHSVVDRFEGGERYLVELDAEAQTPILRLAREPADLLRYQPPAEGRFMLYARNADSAEWLSVCAFPRGGSVEKCCFIPPPGQSDPVVAYEPGGATGDDYAGPFPDIGGRWIRTFPLMPEWNELWEFTQTGGRIVATQEGADLSVTARFVSRNRIRSEHDVVYVLSEDEQSIREEGGTGLFRRMTQAQAAPSRADPAARRPGAVRGNQTLGDSLRSGGARIDW